MLSCNWRALLVSLILYLHLAAVGGVVSVPVAQVGHNFACPVDLDGTLNSEILDTGSSQLANYNKSIVYNANLSHSDCLYLTVDGTYIRYQSQSPYNCEILSYNLEIGSSRAYSNTTGAQVLLIQNEELHAWDDANGVLGATYCHSGYSYNSFCEYPTTFQQLVQNATTDGASNDSMVFGLDFRTSTASSNDKYLYTPASTVNSSSGSLEIGGVASDYIATLQWLQQPETKPAYHEFFLEDFSFCDQYPLGNFSMNWRVLVDTGASCVTLPGDIYDNFEAWFDNSSVFTDVNRMPAFSFQLSTGEVTPAAFDSATRPSPSTIYIPLADLLVNASAMAGEPGAPYVTVSTDDGEAVELQRLCIVRGSAVTRTVNADEEVYNSPPPSIVLGALAIQSLYLSANFANESLGMANKLTPTYIAGLTMSNDATTSNNDVNAVGCAAPVECEGDQTFIPSSNSCQNPSCKRYYFTYMNKDTKKCEYDSTDYLGGLIVILLIAGADVIAYFVTQYSAHTALDTGLRGVPGALPDHLQMDPVTKYLGWFFTLFVDLIVIYLLNWAPPPRPRQPAIVVAGEGPAAGGR